ncbi:MAG: lyase [Nannocystis sp.]|uniref:lyase n=1 Tax=Nannocystis sp. TaxID=1962667 RepID=UPI0024289EE0|nr:lyase [Nannocystis sp.]MBK9753497.1 lyase [Nannocystis sp.]
MIALRVHTLTACLPLCLFACGDSGRESASGDTGTASVASQGSISLTNGEPTSASAASDSATGGSVSDSATSDATGNVSGQPTTDNSASDTNGPKFDLGVAPDIGSGGCGDSGGGMLDTSYIWIPSTSDGWVVKINTRTMLEEGRYLTGPGGGAESVSRTAVSGDGRFVVVNGRGSGRSTAVAAGVEDCKDTNGDGMITTSSGAGDVKPWGSDECVVWTLVHAAWDGGDTHGPRGISWTAGEWNEGLCGFINPKVWLGYLAGGGEAHLVRLDGPTGAIEQDLIAPGWDGSGYAPYGGALDPMQRPWFTGLRGELARVDVTANPLTITRFPQPQQIQTYGMTVDPDGNPWMGGCSGPVSTFDVATSQWISIPGTNACHRGMAVDHNFHVWVASNGPCGLVEVDGKTRTLVAQHQLAQCSTPIGVSVDVDGFVWLVDQEGWAWKIDPDNVPAMQNMAVPGSHYVYSDMTGGQLKSVSPPPG